VSTNLPEAIPSFKASRKGSVAAILSRIWVTHRPAFYTVPVGVERLGGRLPSGLEGESTDILEPYVRSLS